MCRSRVGSLTSVPVRYSENTASLSVAYVEASRKPLRAGSLPNILATANPMEPGGNEFKNYTVTTYFAT